MAKGFAKGLYNSKKWKDTQRAFRQSKFGICERCKQPKGTIVHHKKHLDESNISEVNISLNWNNLELLCIDCHNQEHFKKHKATAEGLRFNSEGELVKDYTPH